MTDTPDTTTPDAPHGDGVGDIPADKGGESGGGAYPNPHTGKTPDGGGFMGHGGQTDIGYRGTGGDGDPDADNDNAVTE